MEIDIRNRGNEFNSIIQGLNGQRAVNGLMKNGSVTRQSQFTIASKKIGKDLASTLVKLDKLAALAKQKSLFDDRSEEIQELTYIIRQDMNSLNQQIGGLQNITKSGQWKSNSAGRGGGKQEHSHTKAVVLGLQSRLANMSNTFKSVLEQRTESLKEQRERRQKLGGGSANSGSAPMLNGGPSRETDPLLDEKMAKLGISKPGSRSLLLEDEERSRQPGYNVSYTASPNGLSGPGPSTLDGVRPRQRLQDQQLQVVDQTHGYLQSRADTMQQIESTIVELGGIFQQLATMVSTQQELVTRIDQNVDDAEMNVEMAHGELTRYLRSVSSNRWLMAKIFGVLIIFFVIFVVFML